jgi:hypothetical protein
VASRQAAASGRDRKKAARCGFWATGALRYHRRPVAKKVRTPPPPRKVQAPQRRDSKRRDGKRPAIQTDRNRLWGLIALLVLVAVAAIAAALFFALRHNGGSKATSGVNYNALPGVQKIKAPWPPEYAHLDVRLAPLGLDSLQQEQLAYHIHQHLDIFLNGKHLVVPECIGIYGCYKHFVYLTELHTHATDGVIHVEAAAHRIYTLGDFFAEWGVYLSRQCVGAYCQGYSWYVNGKRQTGNPASLELTPHLEIVFAIGTPPKKIPSTYPFTALGL